jgi:4-hydroxy-tetrahydrodipicolinate reductase
MNLLLLGYGKTGSLVAEVARERGHTIEVLTSQENAQAGALTAERLKGIDAAIDFTNPEAVLDNIAACIQHRCPLVIGTTGWYHKLGDIEREVQKAGAALLYASNFSVGVNLFFEIVATASAALGQGYEAKIVERHHTQKKDAPSGTACFMQRIIEDAANTKPEITSVREGDTVGTHVLLLDSQNDTMMLVHDAKSRRGYAEGAVRAAEWLVGKTGFYEFRKVLKEALSIQHSAFSQRPPSR